MNVKWHCKYYFVFGIPLLAKHNFLISLDQRGEPCKNAHWELTRLMPRPPARVEIRKIKSWLWGLLNSAICFWRSAADVLPSILIHHPRPENPLQLKRLKPSIIWPLITRSCRREEKRRRALPHSHHICLVNMEHLEKEYPRWLKKSSRISSILVICEKRSTRCPSSFNFGSSCRQTHSILPSVTGITDLNLF